MAIKKKPVEKKKSTPAKKAAGSHGKTAGKASVKPVKSATSKKKAVPAAKTKTQVAAKTKKPTSTVKKAIVKKTTTVKKSTATKKATAPAKKEEAPKAKSTGKSAPQHKTAAAPKAEAPKAKKPAAPKKDLKAIHTKSAPHVEEPKAKKAAPKKVAPKKAPITNPRFIYRPEPSILDAPQENNGPRRRYSDNDLQEFKELIQRKLESARKELVYLQGLITRKDEAGTDDTENKYMGVEDGGGTMEREQLSQLASRQIQYIDHLEKALVRIENKTYGICRVTGKLIDKARLRAVPHATLSIEAKLANKK